MPGVLRIRKHVTFADGINPGMKLAASPTHDKSGRPLSPTPLKALMRETLKLKRNMYPFKKSVLRRTRLMMQKKVATVSPLVKSTSSDPEYYISRHHAHYLTVAEMAASSSVKVSNDSPLDSDDDHQHSNVKIASPPRPPREVTPVPSDNECWNDDDVDENDDNNMKNDS